MSKVQKIALLVIWLGILGSIAAVLFSWQVRQEWLSPGGYMTVRRNLLTAEEDVWVGGQWVPLPQYPRGPAQVLGESRRERVAEPPTSAPGKPLLPSRFPPPDATEAPSRSAQQAAVPASPPARSYAPVRVKATPAPRQPPHSEAAASPAGGDGSQRAASIDPDLPIVRAPSPDESQTVEAPPSPVDEVAPADSNAPDQARQAAAPPVCDPSALGAVC